jgi:transposase
MTPFRTEGQIRRFKLLNRQVYGRAKDNRLRQWVRRAS